jgi:hypothetical protein
MGAEHTNRVPHPDLHITECQFHVFAINVGVFSNWTAVGSRVLWWQTKTIIWELLCPDRYRIGYCCWICCWWIWIHQHWILRFAFAVAFRFVLICQVLLVSCVLIWFGYWCFCLCFHEAVCWWSPRISSFPWEGFVCFCISWAPYWLDLRWCMHS